MERQKKMNVKNEKYLKKGKMKRKIFKNTKEISVKEKCNRKNVENTMVND